MHARDYSLSAIVMVASKTSKNGGRTVIHMCIPVVDVTGQSAILGLVATSMATLEPPQTILPTIVMETAHSRHHIIGVTHEREGQVPIIYVSRPIARREWIGHNILTHEVPATILSAIVMITFYSINSLVVVAIHEKVAIEIILVSSYSIEC